MNPEVGAEQSLIEGQNQNFHNQPKQKRPHQNGTFAPFIAQ